MGAIRKHWSGKGKHRTMPCDITITESYHDIGKKGFNITREALNTAIKEYIMSGGIIERIVVEHEDNYNPAFTADDPDNWL